MFLQLNNLPVADGGVGDLTRKVLLTFPANFVQDVAGNANTEEQVMEIIFSQYAHDVLDDKVQKEYQYDDANPTIQYPFTFVNELFSILTRLQAFILLYFTLF